MATLKRIGPLSLAKIHGLTGVCIGLIIGLIVTIVSFFAADEGFSIFGHFAVIVLPIFYGVLFFLIGLLVAAIYNVFAKWVGGVEIEIKK